MTDRTIASIISKLNKGTVKESIFLKPLSNNIEYGIVWTGKPRIGENLNFIDENYTKAYFIKNEQLLYIGCVFVFSYDLHWFVSKKYRKKGYLTTALKKTILPHLLGEKEEQLISISFKEISINNAKDSENVAIKLGFELLDEKMWKKIFIVKKSQYPDYKAEETLDVTSFDKYRLALLIERLQYYSQCVIKINSELDIKLGESENLIELKDTASQLFKISRRLKNEFWNIFN